MRWPYFCFCHTGLNPVHGSEHFLMYRIFWRTQSDKIAVYILQKCGWPAHVKVSPNGDCKLLQTCEISVSSNVEVDARPISRIWFAVCDCRTTSGNSGQQLPGFVGKNMQFRVARSMYPPHFTGRFCATRCESVKLRKNRGDANSGAQQNNWFRARPQNEFVPRRADLQFVADLRCVDKMV